jgi:hypothetical protein
MLAAPAAALGAQEPVRLTSAEIKDLLKRIDKDTERFRKTVNSALDKSVLDKSKGENLINRYLKDMEHYTDVLKNNYSDHNAATATVQEILARGSNIEGFVQQNQLKEPVTTDWGVLRGDLDQLAAAYGVKWGTTGVIGTPYRVSEKEVTDLLARIDHNSEALRKTLNDTLDKSALDKTSTEHDYNRFMKDFTAATDRLEDSYGDRNVASDNVAEVLQKAKIINEHMKKYPQATKAQSEWALVRTDLETLAGFYRVSWRW